ncbi:MAG: HD domain-containing protein, partial [Planctomycetota bacterium]|nr:HD domain-containing protein [Planctomycetota bacterium]
GAQFGVVIIPDDVGDVEVATFRSDRAYVDGRRPEGVDFSDPPTDASRRDFTVNGLFEDPDTGEVHDYVDGMADIQSRLVRAIGDAEARFREDHLRILRAIRFAVQLNFAIEPATWRAVVKLAPLVASVSQERIRDELLKLLLHGRGRGLRLLRDAGLLPIVLPEIDAMQGVVQPPQFHPEGDVFVHTCLVLDGVDLEDLAERDGIDDVESQVALLLAALLHDVSKPDTYTRDDDGRVRFNGHEAMGRDAAASILERLRLPRRVRERVSDLVGQHMKFGAVQAMRESKLRRFLGQEDTPLHLALHAADCGASHGKTDALEFCRDKLAAYGAEPVVPPPLVQGRDLLELGYRQGPRLGRILRWVLDLQLEGQVTDKAEAVRRVRDEWPIDDVEA